MAVRQRSTRCRLHLFCGMGASSFWSRSRRLTSANADSIWGLLTPGRWMPSAAASKSASGRMSRKGQTHTRFSPDDSGITKIRKKQVCKRKVVRGFAPLRRAAEMSNMTEQQSNVFGALKLIEQLYLDGQIPGYIFRNILKDYGDEIDAAGFRCYANEVPAFDEGTVCTE